MKIIEKAFFQSCNSHFLKSLYKMCTYKLQLVIVCQKKMDSQINLGRTISAVIFNVRHIRYSIKNSVVIVNKRFDIGMLLQLKGPTFSLKSPLVLFFTQLHTLDVIKQKLQSSKFFQYPLTRCYKINAK